MASSILATPPGPSPRYPPCDSDQRERSDSFGTVKPLESSTWRCHHGVVFFAMLTQRLKLKRIYGETSSAMQGIKMRCGTPAPVGCLGLPTSKEYYGGLTAPLVIHILAFPGGFRRCSQKRVVSRLQDGGLITHTKIHLIAGCFSSRRRRFCSAENPDARLDARGQWSQTNRLQNRCGGAHGNDSTWSVLSCRQAWHRRLIPKSKI